MNRYPSRTRRTRRWVLLAVLVPAAAFVAYEALDAPRSGGTGTGRPLIGSDAPGGVVAYLVGTGIFARPAPGEQSGEFAAAEDAAAAAGAPLAFSVWTDRQSFDTRAWRDLLQVGRVPFYRPPAIDFRREVAVLVWPATLTAPDALQRAPGLILRGAALQHTAVEVRVAPATDGTPRATPVGRPDVLPYALVTVPRSQWPIPAPPPTVPPLTVSLAQ